MTISHELFEQSKCCKAHVYSVVCDGVDWAGRGWLWIVPIVGSRSK